MRNSHIATSRLRLAARPESGRSEDGPQPPRNSVASARRRAPGKPWRGGLRYVSVRAQFLGATACALIVVSALIYSIFFPQLEKPAQTGLRSRAETLAEVYAANLGPHMAFSDDAALQAQLQELAAERGVSYAEVLDEGGRVLAVVGNPPAGPGAMEGRAGLTARGGSLEARVSRPILAYRRPAGYLAVGVSSADVLAEIERYRRLTLLVSLLVLGLGFAGALVLSRYITGPLREVSGRLTEISRGDFTGITELDSSSETRQLSWALNAMAVDVSGALLEVHQSSQAVTQAVAHISRSLGEMGGGARSQAEASADVAASVEEMARTVAETSRRLQGTLEMARDSRHAAEGGLGVVENAARVMRETGSAVERMAGILNNLGEHSGRIGAVVDVIEEIADQTNLLALNAAIEAARAGDQGRGFAVVADEVRKLAERTRQATKEIAERVEAVQTGTAQVIQAMESGRGATEASRSALALEACESLQKIRQLSAGVEAEIEIVARGGREQADTSQEIAQRIENIAVIAQATSRSAEESAVASRQLGTQAAALSARLQRFKLPQDPGLAA